MKAINKRDHLAVIYALKQMEDLLNQEVEGFIRHSDTLSELYQHYQALLVELSVCIAEYEVLHHHLKVKVLAPAIRKAKKRSEMSLVI